MCKVLFSGYNGNQFWAKTDLLPPNTNCSVQALDTRLWDQVVYRGLNKVAACVNGWLTYGWLCHRGASASLIASCMTKQTRYTTHT